jgi:hypothetical protein
VSIYVFIYHLGEGLAEHSSEKLDEALRVLASEQTTWKIVCEKFGESIEKTV